MENAFPRDCAKFPRFLSAGNTRIGSMRSKGDLSSHLAAEIGRELGGQWLEMLGSDPSASQQFLDFDLAACVETRCGAVVDPRNMGENAREEWRGRALDANESFARLEGSRRCFLLRRGSEHIGTVAFTVARERQAYVLNLSSLYVLPEHRRRGCARRALGAIQSAARQFNVEKVTLKAEWSAHAAIQLYCAAGMWVTWNELEIQFTSMPGLPAWHVAIEGDDAHFIVGEKARELICATRSGDRLVWRELPELERRCHRLLRRRAAVTFALALAMRGWPLKQGGEEHASEGVEQAALAIQLSEAWYRTHGWPVRTPVIPGLAKITLFCI